MTKPVVAPLRAKVAELEAELSKLRKDMERQANALNQTAQENIELHDKLVKQATEDMSSFTVVEVENILAARANAEIRLAALNVELVHLRNMERWVRRTFDRERTDMETRIALCELEEVLRNLESWDRGERHRCSEHL